MLGARFCRTVPTRIIVVEYARQPRAALILRSGRSPRLEGWGRPHASRGCPPSPFETLAIARGRRAWSRSRLAPQGEGGPRARPLRHVGWTWRKHLLRSFPRTARRRRA